MLVNSPRGQLAEFGLIAPKGVWRVPELETLAQDGELPDPARACAELILMQIEDLQSKIKAIERTILARHRANELSLRLASILGVRIIMATALAAIVANAGAFKSGRHRGLDRAGAAPEWQWRQDGIGRDLQELRAISAVTARARRNRSRPLCPQ